MKNLRIALCEDNPEEQLHLLRIIENYQIPTTVTVFCNGEELLADYQVREFDVIFMDIYMGGMSGVKTVEAIREIDKNVSVAFTTSSTDYTLASYRLGAIKYIEKPVGDRSVFELLDLAWLKKKNEPQLILKIKGRLTSIPFDRILYTEQKSHTLFVYLTGGEIVQVNEKLNDIEKQFDKEYFFRSHKSYLVNLAYVKKVNTDLMVFTMIEGENVYIRRDSLSIAKKTFEAYLFKMAREISNE